MKGERVQLGPEDITIPERLRGRLDEEKVRRIAQRMEQIGLLTPPLVWDGDTDGAEAILIAGRHRVEAAKRLGWEYIDCIFVDDTDAIWREMVEIDENLARAELSTAERDRHLLRRKQLWQARRKNGAPCATLKEKGRGNKGFASETSEITGLSKATINRAVARAEAARDPDHHPKQQAQRHPQRDEDKVLAEFYRWWNRATDRQRRLAIQWVADTDRPGQAPIDEIVETLRSALRKGRVEVRDRGFVAGILKHSKTGNWWPTPAQEFAARKLAEELTAEPLLEDIVIDEGAT